MTSFADRRGVLPLALLAVVLTAGAPSPAPPEIERAVAAQIADAWDVPAEALHMEWGRIPADAIWTEGSSCRLLGRGADGWYAVVMESPGASIASFRVRAGLMDTVWVAARSLPAGARIGDDDARPDVRSTWGPPARDRNALPRAGWETRRAVAAGEALAPPAVAPPIWITAGDTVGLAWARGPVRISFSGQALNSAREGETVRVRVPGRPDSLSGIAVAEGQVALGPGGQS